MDRNEGPYTVDINKEKIAYQDYDELNSIVRNIFFNERSSGKPVYMDWADIDDDAIKKASDKKYISKTELFTDLGKVIKGTLRLNHEENWKNGVFILHRIRAKNWNDPDDKKYEISKEDSHHYNKSGHPPVIALLAAFSNAAESMNEGKDRSQTNYYKPLEDMLNITSDEDKSNLQGSYAKDAVLLWETLNQWLEDNDHVYGIPTAAPIFSNRNKVSYAESQALLRDADRKCLRKIFENPSYKISEHTRFQDIAKQYVQDWIMQKNESTAQIRNFWNIGLDIQEKICEAAIAEFEEWKIDRKDSPNSYRENQDINLSWVINYSDEIEGAKAEFYMTANNFVNENSAKLEFKNESSKEILKDDADIFLKYEESYKFSYIHPFKNINIHHLLHKPLELTLGKFNFSHKPNNIIMFSERNGMYNEIISSAFQRPSSLWVRQGVLCHKSIYKEVKKFIEEYSSDAFKELDSRTSGVIEDWYLFINVVFTKVPDKEVINKILTDKSTRNIAVMIPNENNEEIIIEGGLRLIQNRWHENNPPNVYCIESSKEIVAKIKMQKEDSEILLQEPDDLNKFKDNIKDKNIEVRIKSKQKPKKNIEFRSANRPMMQSVINKNIRLGYSKSSVTLYSAENIKDTTSFFFQGLLCDSAIDNKNMDSLNKYKAYRMNSNFKDSSVTSQDYSLEKKYLSLEDNCVSRGHIKWRIPNDLSKIKDKLQRKIEEEEERKKNGGNFESMVCLECGIHTSIILYKKKCKGKNSKPNKLNNKLSSNLENQNNNISTTFSENIRFLDTSKISIDHVFDGLCYLGGGNGESLNRIISQAYNKTLEIKIIIENLINLGHIDVVKDKNMSLKQWKISPLVLNIKKNEVFLSGFRSDKIISILDKKFTKKYAWEIKKLEQKLSPTRISWFSENSINEISIKDMMKNLNESFDQEIHIAKNSSINILQNLKSFSEYFKFYEENINEADIALKYEKFNIDSGKWESSLIKEKGSYRELGGFAKYYYFNGEDLIYAPHEIVKTKAALEGNKIIHEYDEEKKEFRCFMNAEPPGIYKRALISENGRTPLIESGIKIFKDIPPSLGLLLMYKLYG